MFKHILLTRFNLKYDGIAGFNKKNQFKQTEEWLDSRFGLFERFCFPSVKNQTCQNFLWFVMFSSETPGRYKNRIAQYQDEYPNFKPLFLEDGTYEAMRIAFYEGIKPYMIPGDDYVISTRLDNDDSIHREMIASIQANFSVRDDGFISYIYGLQYDMSSKLLTRMRYRNNHFISRIERLTDGIESVLLHDHTQIDKVSDVLYIDNKHQPNWLEIVHGKNLINKIDAFSRPVFDGSILSDFSLSEKISRINTLWFLLNHLRIKILYSGSKIFRKN